MVLLFWCWLTHVVLEKRPLDECNVVVFVLKVQWCYAGMVMCLGQGADLHMASACVIFILHQKIQKMAKCTFWYWLTRIVSDKVQRAVKWLCLCGNISQYGAIP